MHPMCDFHSLRPAKNVIVGTLVFCTLCRYAKISYMPYSSYAQATSSFHSFRPAKNEWLCRSTKMLYMRYTSYAQATSYFCSFWPAKNASSLIISVCASTYNSRIHGTIESCSEKQWSSSHFNIMRLFARASHVVVSDSCTWQLLHARDDPASEFFRGPPRAWHDASQLWYRGPPRRTCDASHIRSFFSRGFHDRSKYCSFSHPSNPDLHLFNLVKRCILFPSLFKLSLRNPMIIFAVW